MGLAERSVILNDGESHYVIACGVQSLTGSRPDSWSCG
jgi:hypothetical protein